MVNVNYHVLSNSMVLNFNGQTHNIHSSDPRYNSILEAIKKDNLEAIPDLVDNAKVYVAAGLELKNNTLYLDGQILPEALADRIIQFQKEQLPYEYLLKFARKLRNNPSYNSREQLYKFLEHNGHPITKQGNFIAYRGVTDDFKDVHTRTFNNKPGSVCEIPRSEVDDNPNNTCSHGLHVACYEYAKSFGPKLVEVEVDPSDVVCVPTDYNGTKMRVCRFKVVAEAQKMNEAALVDSSYGEPIPEFLVESEKQQSINPIYKVKLKSSSVVEDAFYDPESEILDVILVSGATYHYQNVPQDEIEAWEQASSSGSYFSKYIARTLEYQV